MRATASRRLAEVDGTSRLARAARRSPIRPSAQPESGPWQGSKPLLVASREQLQVSETLPWSRWFGISGTHPQGSGVWTCDPVGDGTASGDERLSRPRARDWLLIALVAFSLLGLGERCRVNPHLMSPSATLHRYWEALRAGDEASVAECLVEGTRDLPFPGMLWFLPPTRELWIDDFRSLPVQAGRVLTTYQVHFVANGTDDVETFRTGSELVRNRGEWRIARPLGEASMPEWRPIHRAVDS
jgi:hypothetical protein